MRNSYTANVPFEIGVKLKEAGYWNPRCTYESNYNDPCYFIPGKRFYDEGVVAPWEEIVPAPTYAQIFDWFASERGIVITLEPFFTMALVGNTAYTWKVTYVDHENASIENVTEEDMWKSGAFGGSFCLTANAAIEFATTLGDKRLKFTEVNIEDL